MDGRLNVLTGVWQSLTPLYNAIEEMKEKTWLSVQPRKLRQNLDELLAQLKQLPAKYRSYESYDYAKRTMQNYSKVSTRLSFVEDIFNIKSITLPHFQYLSQ